MQQIRSIQEMDIKLGERFQKVFTETWEHKKAGGLVCWSTSGGYNEFLRELGIRVVIPEVYGMVLSSTGMSPELCRNTDIYGYSPDLCSIIRSFSGFALSDPPMDPSTLPFGGFPKPDVLFCADYCPGLVKMWQEFARVFDIPMYVMEHPWVPDAVSADPEEMGNKVQECMTEFAGAISFFENFSGQKLAEDQLQKIANNMKEASVLWHDILAMNQNIPAPLSFFDVANQFAVFQFYKGTDECVQYYKELKAFVEDRVANTVTSIPEKYRVFWFGLPIGYRMAQHIEKFTRIQVQPVMSQWACYFGNPNMETNDPIRGIVQYHNLSTLQFRGVEWKRDYILKLIEDYKVDGIILEISRTCQVINFDQKDIAETLVKKTGLPMVSFEADLCDERLYSDEQFNNAVDSLVEMMERRGPGRL
ncbi:MAG: 2-hydroxyacyl-CoA dehydratase [Desulfatitalea sp.]|nr:2-hydroxyacyl-CoA dehydratase family protein [Desulfatitalea sp.]NNJ99666.1 2-hydroxyacyl-CoA dehydratase [Desulfatitalea sp.]